MNKNTLIAVVILLVVIGGGYFYWKNMEAKKMMEAVPAPAANEQGTAPAGNAMQPAGTKVDVAIKGFAFTPAEVKIKKGETVVWTNEDAAPHTATALDNSFDSKTINKGESFSFTFQNAGTFEYKCTFHPAMKTGKIIVE